MIPNPDSDIMHYNLLTEQAKYCKTIEKEIDNMSSVTEELLNEGRKEGIAESINEVISGITEEMKTAGIDEETIKTIIDNYIAKFAPEIN